LGGVNTTHSQSACKRMLQSFMPKETHSMHGMMGWRKQNQRHSGK
jgi:hypothetical protein